MAPQINHPMSSDEYSLLKWRARRGLLENDILLERFFAKHPSLTQAEGLALTHILNLTDRILMDLLMNKIATPLELRAGSSAQQLKNANEIDEFSHGANKGKNITLESTGLADQEIVQFAKLPEIDQSMADMIQDMIKKLQDA